MWRAANELRAALAEKVLTTCDVRVPRYATVDLSGHRVDSVASRGKHLLIRVGEASIHTHLKMEGQWQIYRPGERWRRPAPSSAHHLGHRRLCSSWLFTGNHRDPRTRAGTGGRRTSRTGSARDRLGQFRGRTKSSGCRLRTDRNRAPGSAGDGRTGQRVPKRDLLPTRYPPENADTSRGESRRDSGSVFSHHQRQQVTSHPGHHRRHPPR